MVTTRRLRTAMVAAVLVLAAGLAGCSGTPGAAAVVDGEQISEATLAQTVADLGQFTDVPPQTALQELILSPFIEEAAAANGFGVSDQEGRAFMEDAATRAGADAADLELGPGALLLGRRFAAQAKAQEAGRVTEVEAAATELIRAADVEVSPRYGRWEDLGITYISRPWLVGATPAPTPAP